MKIKTYQPFLKKLAQKVRKKLKEDGLDIKVSFTDLIALACQNDPYYCGTQADIRNGEWFADVWRKYGRPNLHLRGFHYILVSQGDVKRPWRNTLKPYENTEQDWNFLNLASKSARYLGLVNPLEFDDQKNEVKIYSSLFPWQAIKNEIDEKIRKKVIDGVIIEPDLSLDLHFDLPSFKDLDYSELDEYIASLQPYIVEIWIEKSTMNSVIEPICRKYGVNLVYGEGFISITQVAKFLQRVKKAGKGGRILYISDFDPAGDFMPKSIARQLEYWSREFGIKDVKLDHIALTYEQVLKYRLPTVPIKESDKRQANFSQRFSVDGAVELDALEALYEGELSRLVEKELQDLFDTDYPEKLWQAIEKFNEDRKKHYERILEKYREEMNEAMEYIEKVKEKYRQIEDLFDEYLQEISPAIEKMKKIQENIQQDMKNMDHGFQPPEPAKKDRSKWLFDSNREYFSQLKEYKKHEKRKDLDIILETARQIAYEEAKKKN